MTVGDMSQLGIVSDDDESLTILFAERKKEVVKFASILAVEITRRFVGEDKSGVIDESASHSDTLLFATRELSRFVAGTTVDMKEFKQLVSTMGGLFERSARNKGGKADVVDGGEFGKELVRLEDKANVPVAELSEATFVEARNIDNLRGSIGRWQRKTNGTTVGTKKGTENLEQGSLASTRSTHDGDNLGRFHLERYIAQHVQRGKRLVDI